MLYISRIGSCNRLDVANLDGKRTIEMAMADTGEPAVAPSGVDLDRLSDDEVLSLIIAAFDRLRPDQLAQAQNAILERRKVREEEVRNAFLVEMRERAHELGISIESLFPEQTENEK